MMQFFICNLCRNDFCVSYIFYIAAWTWSVNFLIEG